MSQTLQAATSGEQLRTEAMNAAAAGRYDHARELLAAAVERSAGPKTELLSDIAAIALRAGDLAQAIAVARHTLGLAPQHDATRFTLAMSLAAIGSNAEALELLDALNHGEAGARFHRETPELAALAATEAARLRSQRPAGAAPLAAATAHKYDFAHLTQPLNQLVGGPIQDDEALLFYALVRTMRVRRVLEIGGLDGYSARNFLAALSWDIGTALYTVDINPVQSQAANHHTICKDAALLDAADLHGQPLDLVFFDCHVFDAQMNLYVRLVNEGLITDATVIALHDTGLHPVQTVEWAYAVRDGDGVCGYVHQPVERDMVNALRRQFGYDAICAHTDVRRNDKRLPYRHGVTVMKKFFELKT